MSTRAGVLALMLHSTYDHDMMEQLAKDVASSQSESNSWAPWRNNINNTF